MGELPEALQVSLISVLNDNYIFVIARGQQAAVVDPAEADPVIAALDAKGLELKAILQTHHHSDHIGGTPGLLQRWPQARVIASAADRLRIPLQTEGVQQGDHFPLLGEEVQVLDVPGHTRAHIAFVLPVSGHLFCGDTLFAGGCGRLFEGTAEQMYGSLQALAALPAETQVWCAHEYTQANLCWAAQQQPEDPAIAARLADVLERRHQGLPTIPSSIGLERATNLFVRACSTSELADRRLSKDHWKA
jgi:hydroxyacylglutathione hydrolase